ncbi:MAG: hypothetical protein ACLR5R_04520 [Eubacterium sp.]|uniref:hypothetical protein n=2 Tax=Eubacterium sp. TaxID=142586 RepID=UPI0025C61E66|nr:hypothetical protein [Eubacterium sp.]
MLNINNEFNISENNYYIDTVNKLNDCCSKLLQIINELETNTNSSDIKLLSKEDVKRITGWSSRRVSQTFDSPELKDKVIYIGKKMQIEESDFRRYLQSGPKKDSSTYWLKQIN